jgi:hypothetical protein
MSLYKIDPIIKLGLAVKATCVISEIHALLASLPKTKVIWLSKFRLALSSSLYKNSGKGKKLIKFEHGLIKEFRSLQIFTPPPGGGGGGPGGGGGFPGWHTP